MNVYIKPHNLPDWTLWRANVRTGREAIESVREYQASQPDGAYWYRVIEGGRMTAYGKFYVPHPDGALEIPFN